MNQGGRAASRAHPDGHPPSDGSRSTGAGRAGRRRALAALAAAGAAPLLPGCGGGNAVPDLRPGSELVVLTYRSATTWFEDAEGRTAGVEHDLATRFAAEAGYRLRFVVLPQLADVLPALARRQGHFAAAGIAVSPELEGRFRVGPSYQEVAIEVVHDADARRPQGPSDLAGRRVEVMDGTPALAELERLRATVPELAWKLSEALDTEELVARVTGGLVDYAVAESHAIALARNYHVTIATAFRLGTPRRLAWAMPAPADDRLPRELGAFFERVRGDGSLARLLDRYYGHLQRLGEADLAYFASRVRTVLPLYRRFFHEAQDITGLDWRLVAALGFQESHWDPKAVSYTGVRGLMMMQDDTAAKMGVRNLLDPRENILGGARYLAMLRDLLGRAPEPDRTWIALAAYNIGFGHLEDARALARERKLDPNLWVQLKEVLPLLMRPEIAARTRFGRARGGEAVILTENVRQYYDILRRIEQPHQPAFRSLGEEISLLPPGTRPPRLGGR